MIVTGYYGLDFEPITFRVPKLLILMRQGNRVAGEKSANLGRTPICIGFDWRRHNVNEEKVGKPVV